ncbi:hypothetical protein WG901_14160 [Novosphingobium sp. PS1R-30]|uniref:Uncharacterized protein n=1 Tax=Novosphingobium anseongense TaxID=3133436 RepID=A0ABU8RXH6_9SPHN
MSAQDKIAVAIAEAGRARRGAMVATAGRTVELPLKEQLIQAVSRGAGIVALLGTVTLLGWLAI